MIGIARYDYMIHFCKRNHIEKNDRINSIMEILKFTSLNLNDFKIVELSLAVVIVDRGHQYDSFAKRIN
jgi:hypothetical protein